MTETTPSSQSDDPARWTEAQALELWKYFGGVGAADKNTMVTVETLLLTLSSTALGYLITQIFCFNPFSVTKPYQGLGVAVLGLAISLVAAFLAVLYGGYSNWNWGMADFIARTQRDEIARTQTSWIAPTRLRDTATPPIKWEALLPEKADTWETLPPREADTFVERKPDPNAWFHLPKEALTFIERMTDPNAWFHKEAMEWGRPCEPTRRLAPIFTVFTIVALLAAFLHAGVAVLSACFLPWWR